MESSFGLTNRPSAYLANFQLATRLEMKRLEKANHKYASCSVYKAWAPVQQNELLQGLDPPMVCVTGPSRTKTKSATRASS